MTNAWTPMTPINLRPKEEQELIRNLIAKDRELRAREITNLIDAGNFGDVS